MKKIEINQAREMVPSIRCFCVLMRTRVGWPRTLIKMRIAACTRRPSTEKGEAGSLKLVNSQSSLLSSKW